MPHLLLEEAHQSRWAGLINGSWDGCKQGRSQLSQQKAHSYRSRSPNQKGKRREMGNIHLSRPESSRNPAAASTQLSPCRGPRLVLCPCPVTPAYRSVGWKCCRLMLLEANDVARVPALADDTDLFPYQ